jgi:DNA repair exonuclease SbcCD ATPase subunit
MSDIINEIRRIDAERSAAIAERDELKEKLTQRESELELLRVECEYQKERSNNALRERDDNFSRAEQTQKELEENLSKIAELETKLEMKEREKTVDETPDEPAPMNSEPAAEIVEPVIIDEQPAPEKRKADERRSRFFY